MYKHHMFESYLLCAGDDVAKVSVLPSAGKLLHSHVDQLGFDFHVLLLWLLQLLPSFWALNPLHPLVNVRIDLNVRVLCPTGQPQSGPFLRRCCHGLLLPAVGDGNLVLRCAAMHGLQSYHFLERGWLPTVDLWSVTKGLHVEVVQQLGEEGGMLL